MLGKYKADYITRKQVSRDETGTRQFPPTYNQHGTYMYVHTCTCSVGNSTHKTYMLIHAKPYTHMHPI